MNVISTNGHGSPQLWHVVFLTRTDRWWVNLCPGRFKHVKAFGYVAETDCWIFYDVAFSTMVHTARGWSAQAIIAKWLSGGETLTIAPRRLDCVRIIPFSCTTAIANLIGLPLRCVAPDRLYRECLRHGAQPWADQPQKPPK